MPAKILEQSLTPILGYGADTSDGIFGKNACEKSNPQERGRLKPAVNKVLVRAQ